MLKMVVALNLLVPLSNYIYDYSQAVILVWMEITVVIMMVSQKLGVIILLVRMIQLLAEYHLLTKLVFV
jgi:hypothetical protein